MRKPYKINRAGGVEFLGVSVGRITRHGARSPVFKAIRVGGRPLPGVGGDWVGTRLLAAAELCKRFVMDSPEPELLRLRRRAEKRCPECGFKTYNGELCSECACEEDSTP